MGKCSLTVALPILSAMGHSTSVLPTAVLSTHTGFPNPEVQPMTENLLPFAAQMASVGGGFDAISTGYLSDPKQAEAVCQVLDKFDCLKIIDPAMGDHGRLYSRMTQEHVLAMAELFQVSTDELIGKKEGGEEVTEEAPPVPLKPAPRASHIGLIAGIILALLLAPLLHAAFPGTHSDSPASSGWA